jgi:hypothetical protein
MTTQLTGISKLVKQNGAIIVKANGEQFGYFWNGNSVKYCSAEFARKVMSKTKPTFPKV